MTMTRLFLRFLLRAKTLKIYYFAMSTSRTAMALRELPSALGRLAVRDARPILRLSRSNGRRPASGEAVAVKEYSTDIQDLESQSSFQSTGPSEEIIEAYDPIKRAQARRRELPPSRYGSPHIFVLNSPNLTVLKVSVSTS